jgi:hypothetical protein
MELPLAIILSNRVTDRHVNSARPRSPVVVDPARRDIAARRPARGSRWLRTRAGLAATLHAAARAVAPAEPTRAARNGAVCAGG